MKILAIGDFHGTFPKKFYKIIDKEKIDLVISNGDYPPFHYRKLWFKYCFGKDVQLWEVIGKKKAKELVIEDAKRAEVALKALNKLPIPVFTVLGNIDYPPDDVVDFWNKKKNKIPKWDRKESFLKVLKKYKNIQRFDYKALKFGNYVFIGMRGHSNPGRVKSKAFRKHMKILNKLFQKFKDNNIIFVSHNIAYNTKLDKIGAKAHEKVRSKHYGSKLARRIIDRYHPLLHIGGHIHEGIGKQKIGRTWLVNPGSAHEGKATIIDIDEGKVKNVKFVK